MTEFTNISTEPVDHYEGPDGLYPVRPCMKSGFCCNTAPCAYGEKREDSPGCKFLLEPNVLGQRDCGKYDWIVKNVPGYEMYPAFGAGCCMPIGNIARQTVIENIQNYDTNSFKENK